MAEQLSSPSPEAPRSHEVEAPREAEHKHKEHDGEQRAKSKEQSSDNSIETIRQKVDEQAARAAETKVDNTAKSDAKEPQYINRELKAEALRRTLNRTRKHLSKPERALSKAVHQPAVDAISKAGERTIARPTGLLTGSILALAGSSYLLYSAKHYGYQYNYFSVVIIFAGGYLVGLVIELLVHFLRRRAK